MQGLSPDTCYDSLVSLRPEAVGLTELDDFTWGDRYRKKSGSNGHSSLKVRHRV
jgi:hypothetical protein